VWLTPHPRDPQPEGERERVHHSRHFIDKLLTGIHSQPTTHKHKQNTAAITDCLCDARVVSETSD